MKSRYSRIRRDHRINRTPSSRWSLLNLPDNSIDNLDGSFEAKTKQLLSRYGIIFPELLYREPIAPPWRYMVRILRVSGFIGEQFATPEAIEMLRSNRNSDPEDALITISACDPLNLIGILTPGDKIPAIIGNKIVFQGGLPICSLSNGQIINHTQETHPNLNRAKMSLNYQARYSTSSQSESQYTEVGDLL